MLLLIYMVSHSVALPNPNKDGRRDVKRKVKHGMTIENVELVHG